MAHFQFLVPLLSPSTKISTVVANTNLSDPILLYPSSFTVWKQAAGLIRYDTISQKGPMMNTQTTRPIGIKTTYTIDGTDGTTTTTSETFDASRSDACEVRVGLPVDIEPVKSQPGDDSYSGMHDQGPLPPLKEGGPIAFLMGCVGLAKQHSDNFLTKRIEEEKEQLKQQKSSQKQQEEQSESPNTVAKKSSSFPNKRPKQ